MDVSHLTYASANLLICLFLYLVWTWGRLQWTSFYGVLWNPNSSSHNTGYVELGGTIKVLICITEITMTYWIFSLHAIVSLFVVSVWMSTSNSISNLQQMTNCKNVMHNKFVHCTCIRMWPCTWKLYVDKVFPGIS